MGKNFLVKSQLFNQFGNLFVELFQDSKHTAIGVHELSVEVWNTPQESMDSKRLFSKNNTRDSDIFVFSLCVAFQRIVLPIRVYCRRTGMSLAWLREFGVQCEKARRWNSSMEE